MADKTKHDFDSFYNLIVDVEKKISNHLKTEVLNDNHSLYLSSPPSMTGKYTRRMIKLGYNQELMIIWNVNLDFCLPKNRDFFDLKIIVQQEKRKSKRGKKVFESIFSAHDRFSRLLSGDDIKDRIITYLIKEFEMQKLA